MDSAFLEPFWAEEVTMEDGGYMISDRILMRVDTLRWFAPSEMTLDAAEEGV